MQVQILPSSPLTGRKVLTLVFLEKESQILLGLKKRGFGTGYWNGFGGKVESGEKILDAAVREVKEECGLSVEPEDLEQVGLIHFIFEGDPIVLEVHIFKGLKFTGEVEESEEMKPQWWDKEGVPHEQMWADDEVWYPDFYLKGINFQGLFIFEGNTKILAYDIAEFDDLDKKLKGLNGNDEVKIEEGLWEKVKHLPVVYKGMTA